MQGLTDAIGDVLRHGLERLGWHALGQATDHGAQMGAILVVAATALVAFAAVALVRHVRSGVRDRRVRRGVMGQGMVPASRFLSDWSTRKAGNKVTGGYKALDRPGCYVIVTNPDSRWERYEAVYVGQSLHACSRVRSHLTGHGNGDVYADVRNGERVYARIVPCEPGEMNDLERELIGAFRATRHYNRTKGGATRR